MLDDDISTTGFEYPESPDVTRDKGFSTVPPGEYACAQTKI